MECKETISTRQEGENFLFYDTDSNRLLISNDMGEYVWNLLSDKTNLNEVYSSLRKSYPERPSAEQLYQDLVEFIQSLKRVEWVKTTTSDEAFMIKG